MWKNMWSNIKSFWYIGLILFGTVGAMLGMGAGPTVTPRTISLLLEISCALLGVIAIFLHLGQNYVNRREKEIEILKKALHESQEKTAAIQGGFQTTINSLIKELRAWEKKFEESNLPPPTEEEVWGLAQKLETPAPQKRVWEKWEKVKALPLLKNLL
jgi:hypothetical protein